MLKICQLWCRLAIYNWNVYIYHQILKRMKIPLRPAQRLGREVILEVERYWPKKISTCVEYLICKRQYPTKNVRISSYDLVNHKKLIVRLLVLTTLMLKCGILWYFESLKRRVCMLDRKACQPVAFCRANPLHFSYLKSPWKVTF